MRPGGTGPASGRGSGACRQTSTTGRRVGRPDSSGHRQAILETRRGEVRVPRQGTERLDSEDDRSARVDQACDHLQGDIGARRVPAMQSRRHAAQQLGRPSIAMGTPGPLPRGSVSPVARRSPGGRGRGRASKSPATHRRWLEAGRHASACGRRGQMDAPTTDPRRRSRRLCLFWCGGIVPGDVEPGHDGRLCGTDHHANHPEVSWRRGTSAVPHDRPVLSHAREGTSRTR